MFKKQYLYYIVGTIVFVIIYSFDKIGTLMLLGGFGIGYLLHNWLRGMYEDTLNAFFTTETRKRQMKKRELEQELEKLKEGD